jgi:hypothetical protein
MPRADVQILQQSEFQKYSYAGVVPTIRVSFKVGDQGPFTVDVPKDGFTSDKVWDAIDPIANEVQKVNGKQ